MKEAEEQQTRIEGPSRQEERHEEASVRFVAEDEFHHSVKESMLKEAYKRHSRKRGHEQIRAAARNSKESALALKNRSSRHLFQKVELSHRDEEEEFGSSISSTLESLISSNLEVDKVREGQRSSSFAIEESPKTTSVFSNSDSRDSVFSNYSVNSRSDSSRSPKVYLDSLNTASLTAKEIRRQRRKIGKRNTASISNIIDEDEPLEFAQKERKTKSDSRLPVRRKPKNEFIEFETDYIEDVHDEDLIQRGLEKESKPLSTHLASFSGFKRRKSRRSFEAKVVSTKIVEMKKPQCDRIQKMENIEQAVEIDESSSSELSSEDYRHTTATQLFDTSPNPPNVRMKNDAKAEIFATDIGSSLKKSFLGRYRRRMKRKRPRFKLNDSANVVELLDLSNNRRKKDLGEFDRWNHLERSPENTSEFTSNPWEKNFLRVAVHDAKNESHLIIVTCTLLGMASKFCRNQLELGPNQMFNVILESPINKARHPSINYEREERLMQSLGHLKGVSSALDLIGRKLKIYWPYFWIPKKKILICLSFIISEGVVQRLMPVETMKEPMSSRIRISHANSKHKSNRDVKSNLPSIAPIPSFAPIKIDLSNRGSTELEDNRIVDELKGIILLTNPRDMVKTDDLSMERNLDGCPPGTIWSSVILQLQSNKIVEVLISPLLLDNWLEVFVSPAGREITIRKCYIHSQPPKEKDLIEKEVMPPCSTNDGRKILGNEVFDMFYGLTRCDIQSDILMLRINRETTFSLSKPLDSNDFSEKLLSIPEINKELQNASIARACSVCCISEISETYVIVRDGPNCETELKILVKDDRIGWLLTNMIDIGSFILMKNIKLQEAHAVLDGVSSVELVKLTNIFHQNIPVFKFFVNGIEIEWQRDTGKSALLPLIDAVSSKGLKPRKRLIISNVPVAAVCVPLLIRLVQKDAYCSIRRI